MPRIGCALLLLFAVLLLPAGAQARDRDHDRLPDKWEQRFRTAVKAKSAQRDPDRDGLSNLAEYRSKTNPRRPDSDRDRVRDDDEDADRDRVDNGNEAAQGTHPRKRDSDRDGRRDGREDRDRDGLDNAGEDASGNDPTDRDTDDDGVRDGAENAGVVASNAGGTLTIALATGGRVAGALNDDTAVTCSTEDAEEARHRRRGRSGARAGSSQAPGVYPGGGDFDDGGFEDDFQEDEDELSGDESEDDGFGDDGLGDDELSDDDEDWDSFDDEFDREFAEGVEDRNDGSGGDRGARRPCSAEELKRGTRVHSATIQGTADGLAFVAVTLLLP